MDPATLIILTLGALLFIVAVREVRRFELPPEQHGPRRPDFDWPRRHYKRASFSPTTTQAQTLGGEG